MTTLALTETEDDRGVLDHDCRWKLFVALDSAFSPARVLYPACGFDVSPSLVFPDVTYADEDSDVAAFFDNIEGVLDIVAQCSTAPEDAVFRFVHADCSRLRFPRARFDLVISLDTRPVAKSCAGCLKTGGVFVAHAAGQDATTLADAPDFALAAAAVPGPEGFRIRTIDRMNSRRRASLPDTTASASPRHPLDPMSAAAALVYTRIG